MAEIGCLKDGNFQNLQVENAVQGLSTTLGIVGSSLKSKTQMASAFSAPLVINTHYLTPADGNSITATLPTAATSKLGNTIIVSYHVAGVNGQTMKFGTSGEFFSAASSIIRPNGATGSAVGVIKAVDVADGTADDFMNLVGLTNGGPGIGSFVVFTYDGSQWRAEARLETSGTGGAANASVFAGS